jgi:CBS domain-containing protein
MNHTKPIDELVAGDVLHAAVTSVRPGDGLELAERLMVEQRLTGLPVIENGKLAGVISRSDVARVHVLAEALDGQIREELHWDETQADGFKHNDGEKFLGFKQRLEKVHVKDVMRSQVVTCAPETPVREVATLLVRNHIHRVFVVDKNQPLGVINSLDLVALIT